jgi:hypothetical protein
MDMAVGSLSFWDMTPSAVADTNVSVESTASFLRIQEQARSITDSSLPEDGGSRLFRHVSELLPDYIP